MRIYARILLSLVCLLLAAIGAPGQPAVTAASVTVKQKANIVEHYGKLSLAFEANLGQVDSQVKFLSRGAGYNLFLTANEAVLELRSFPGGDQSSASSVLRMKLLNANPRAEVSGQNELPGKSNYFIGNDPKKWHTNVRQYAKVRYANVYPGVDLVYYGNRKELEYDFVVRPGTNPQAIRLRMEGASKLRLEHGDLVLASAAGDVRLRSPHIYQDVNGVRCEVRGGYVVSDKNEVGFAVAAYDRRRALVIDPVLAYSTYLGGTDYDYGSAVAIDSSGSAYITGFTVSLDFPVANALQPKRHGEDDVFVTKFNADGTALVYSTYLGGNASDEAYGIAVDVTGNAYITGFSASYNFPTKNAIQLNNVGGADAFVSKINAIGNQLVYSTYLGGSADDVGFGIALDSAGNAYIAGETSSSDFPALNAIQPNYAGGPKDAFVTKIKADGSVLEYSTFLGGSNDDGASSIAVSPAGNAYVTGHTDSPNFPTKNALQPAYANATDAFVTKLNETGSALDYSTYWGGHEWDIGYGIAVNSTGDAYITGGTKSPDFPTFNPIQEELRGVTDVFITSLNSTGNALLYSTYLGGDSGGSGVAVDAEGNAYIAGATNYGDFPVMNAVQPEYAGNIDAVVAKLNSAGRALVYSTFLGGKDPDFATSIAVDSSGSAYVVGVTTSSNFPKTELAFQQGLKVGAGRYSHDVYLTKIAQQTFVATSPTHLNFGWQVVGTTSKAKKVTVTNLGAEILTINRIYSAGLNAGDFGETDTCGLTLAANASCTVSVTFTPAAKNKRKAVLGISDSDPASPQALRLNGTGTVVSLSKKNLSFGVQQVGTSSAPRSVKLTNTGGTQLNFTSITITGTNVGDFSQTNNCGTSIAAGANCTITVTFKPTAIGTRKAAVSISDDGGGSPQKVTLTGTGT